MSNNRNALLLTILILIGLVAGAIVGQVLFNKYDGNVPANIVDSFEFVGQTFFMSLLRMVLVPLVATSVIVGVSSIGDSGKLGWVGSATLIYYFSTMLVAVTLGLFLVTTISPGKGIEESFRDQQVQDFESSDSMTGKRVMNASGTGHSVHSRTS